VCKTEEFMNLNKDQLIKLIEDDNLIVESEKIVLDAVMAWIAYDSSTRERHIDVLMEHIRWPLLGYDYLKEIAEHPLIKLSEKCRSHIIEGLIGIIEIQKNPNDLNLKSKFKPREASGLPKLILLIGGQAPKAISSVDAYDFRSQSWIKKKDLLSARCRAGIVNLNECVYILGGFNGNCRVRSVDIYNIKNDTWTTGQDMLYRRSTLGAAVLKNKIYVVGGFDGNSGLSSAEFYDPTSNTWQMITSMSTSRSSVGLCTVDGFLYAVGGYSGLLSECLNTVEKYDPNKDRWSLVANMLKRRSGVAVISFEDKIYAFGGHSNLMFSF
jgi:kelch-like protein 2/3